MSIPDDFTPLIEKYLPSIPRSFTNKELEEFIKGSSRYSMEGDDDTIAVIRGNKRTRDGIVVSMEINDSSDFLADLSYDSYGADIEAAQMEGENWELDMGKLKGLDGNEVQFQKHGSVEVDIIQLKRKHESVRLWYDDRDDRWEEED